MKMHSTKGRNTISAAVAGLIAMGSTATPANADSGPGIKAGVLTCDVSSGWGVVVVSSRPAACVFEPVDGAPERYDARFSRLGVDIGYLSSATIGWVVFAPSVDVASGALAGTYVGATAAVSAVYGAGANVLVGGGSSFALQPVSGEANTGYNIAAGLGSLTLSPPE